MSERSKLISKLKTDQRSRTAYINAKLGVLVPSQIRAMRLKSDLPRMPRQEDLAREAKMHQSRISMFERPGSANVTLNTLARLAAVFKVGLVVKFVPFSEMLRWENEFSQDEFNVLKIDEDLDFIAPTLCSADRPGFTPIGSVLRTASTGGSIGVPNYTDPLDMTPISAREAGTDARPVPVFSLNVAGSALTR